MKPRGQVFYQPADDQYIIAVGSWIDQSPEAIERQKTTTGPAWSSLIKAKRAEPSIPSMIPPITLADRQLAIDTSYIKPSIYPLSTLYLPSIYPQVAFRFCL